MAKARDLPNPAEDNSLDSLPGRTGRYSEQYEAVLGGSDQHYFADEGSYFVVRNTTPGTGIAGHAAPSSADNTKPVFYLYNGGKSRLYLKYMRVRMTAIGAGATTTDFAVFVDLAGASTRASGGTLMANPINVNSDSVRASNAVCYIGPVVTVPVNTRKVGEARVRSVVPVVEDQYFFTFGAATAGYPAALATSGTAIVQASVEMPPVVIGPGHVFEFVEWGASQSGAHSFDIECGFVER